MPARLADCRPKQTKLRRKVKMQRPYMTCCCRV
jgi:hypothetical protein